MVEVEEKWDEKDGDGGEGDEHDDEDDDDEDDEEEGIEERVFKADPKLFADMCCALSFAAV